ncbi:MAG: TonB-dependent receptor, partial [Gemmatimonadetes bacterium]|nr:TonB-dependent receptor [Gemmatimonadota bacterium]
MTACFGLVALSPAAGQQPRDTVRLREIVVTATRLPTPIAAVANGITVIRGETLREQGVTHVLEALRAVPGLAVVQTGSFGGLTSLFLRGGESDYVRVLVDGVPINQPGGPVDLANLSTDNVDRIEVVRGPTSVLYGSDAVAGVIQVLTRRGSGPARISLSARAGSYGSTAVDASVLGGAGALGYSLAVSRFGSDGAYAFNNAYRNTTVSGLLRARPDSRSDAQLSVRYNDNSFHFPTDFTGAVTDSNQLTAGDGTTVGFEAGRFLSARIEARALLTAHVTDGLYENGPDSPAETDRFASRTRLSRRAADLRANIHAGASRVLTLGAVVEDEGERGTTLFESSFGTFPDSSRIERTNRAAYAQLLWGWGDRLSLTSGVRFEDNEAFGAFTTYRAGLAYRLGGGTRLRAALGRAFKEPTFYENFATGFDRGNPDLEPERTSSWEAGVERALAGGRLQVTATVFGQRFRDLIDYVSPGPSAQAPNFFNVAAANASGVELEAHASPAAALTLSLAYTYLRTEVTDSGFGGFGSFVTGQRLLRRPTHSASVSADYRLARRGIVGARVIHVGARNDVYATRLPDYTRVDASAQL